ncbi:uncharacterized protein N7459_004743 [Penicillium hispanicum]|uniref:uncharacterized protein n=1 Tax=Penicillium hispanicum TaxID=1080232 RepID=UPI002541C46F|nr:uncharacterized protein N7459_004743 [Penicillium hispanicum]KAJ5584943.1 hypothetical protein N7459_004743 [Penicillium hispanicum]
MPSSHLRQARLSAIHAQYSPTSLERRRQAGPDSGATGQAAPVGSVILRLVAGHGQSLDASFALHARLARKRERMYLGYRQYNGSLMTAVGMLRYLPAVRTQSVTIYLPSLAEPLARRRGTIEGDRARALTRTPVHGRGCGASRLGVAMCRWGIGIRMIRLGLEKCLCEDW